MRNGHEFLFGMQCGPVPIDAEHFSNNPNASMTLIIPPRTCFAIWSYGSGEVAIINDGGGGRTIGSAARRTSNTSKRKPSKIEIFRAGKNALLSPLYDCRWTLSRPCRAPNLLQSKFDCPGFFRSSNSMLLSPQIIMLC